MSRVLIKAVSCNRLSVASCSNLRMSSTGKDCGAAGSNESKTQDSCGPKNTPHITPVCTTDTTETGRRNQNFDKCMAKNIANPTPACTLPQFAMSPCYEQPHPKNRGVVKPIIYKSAWEKLENCNTVTCAVETFRHDVELLKPEAKCHRRTWCEYGGICEVEEECKSPKFDVIAPERRPRVVKEVIIPKIKIDLCEPEKRPSGQTNKAATASQPPIKINPCPRIRLPGCRRANEKLKCVPPVAPKCCQKRCTLYPSFSECCRARADEKSGTECGCTNFQNTCSAFERARWLLLN